MLWCCRFEDFHEAVQWLVKAVEMRETLLGPVSEALASSCGELGKVLLKHTVKARELRLEQGEELPEPNRSKAQERVSANDTDLQRALRMNTNTPSDCVECV